MRDFLLAFALSFVFCLVGIFLPGCTREMRLQATYARWDIEREVSYLSQQ